MLKQVVPEFRDLVDGADEADGFADPFRGFHGADVVAGGLQGDQQVGGVRGQD
ncbi:hypothetical protein [Dactylosporangium sp. NPDC049140]|uniref:hypothetical protein n=1 Tax=Dactylosporangium sp. NPDC049140 TaxID=3155647 RepID=UPI0033E88FDB